MKLNALFYLVLFVLMPVTAVSGDFPQGTFTLTMGKSEFVLTFIDDSSYAIKLIGQFEVDGTYGASGDTLNINDKPGEGSCPSSGMYVWKYENKKLMFKSLSDGCAERAQVMNAGPWILRE